MVQKTRLPVDSFLQCSFSLFPKLLPVFRCMTCCGCGMVFVSYRVLGPTFQNFSSTSCDHETTYSHCLQFRLCHGVRLDRRGHCVKWSHFSNPEPRKSDPSDLLRCTRRCPAMFRLEACPRPTSYHLDSADLPRHGSYGDRRPAAGRIPIVLATNRNGGKLRLNASRA